MRCGKSEAFAAAGQFSTRTMPSFSEDQLSLPLVKALHRSPKEHRATVARHLSDEAMSKVGQYIYNVGHSHLPLSTSKKNQLKKIFAKNWHSLRTIMNPGKSVRTRRRTLIQQFGEGGGLDALLRASIPEVEKLLQKRQPSTPVMKGIFYKKEKKKGKKPDPTTPAKTSKKQREEEDEDKEEKEDEKEDEEYPLPPSPIDQLDVDCPPPITSKDLAKISRLC